MTQNGHLNAEGQLRVRGFNPHEHLMKIGRGDQAKDYLPVAYRLVWFRENFPNGIIETDLVHLDLDRDTEEEVSVWNPEKRRSEKVIKQAKGIAIFKATVKDGLGGIATGTKMEKAASFPDWLEKAETGAIGRALAELGFGTQFTGDEFNEAHRIVDSPVDRSVPASDPTASSAYSPNSQTAATDTGDDANASDQQISSIRKLCTHLKKPVPDDVTSIKYLAAGKLIAQLTNEYKASRQNSNAS
jgi:hypothetical protein